jgi:hypothetical protein
MLDNEIPESMRVGGGMRLLLLFSVSTFPNSVSFFLLASPQRRVSAFLGHGTFQTTTALRAEPQASHLPVGSKLTE